MRVRVRVRARARVRARVRVGVTEAGDIALKDASETHVLQVMQNLLGYS